ncbi:MAG: hypothetical protein A2792_18975 [Sphingomonadales bacterium RIFCSPHIGHO2_01_FULL_65_20]|nr:MAG: hypothetical protein A2792_18975 [Sphingomonadales bacterium RIFCSPHIGHO2_01_FULL_65_20]
MLRCAQQVRIAQFESVMVVAVQSGLDMDECCRVRSPDCMLGQCFQHGTSHQRLTLEGVSHLFITGPYRLEAKYGQRSRRTQVGRMHG